MTDITDSNYITEKTFSERLGDALSDFERRIDARIQAMEERINNKFNVIMWIAGVTIALNLLVFGSMVNLAFTLFADK